MVLRVTISVIRKPAANRVVAARNATKAVTRTQSLSQFIDQPPRIQDAVRMKCRL